MIPSRRYHGQLNNDPGLTVGVTVTVDGRLLEPTARNLFLRWDLAIRPVFLVLFWRPE